MPLCWFHSHHTPTHPHYLYLRGSCGCRSFLRLSLALAGFAGSLGGAGLPTSRGTGGLTASTKGFRGLPGNEGLGIFLAGPFSLRGGGSVPGFSGWLKGEKRLLFLFACSEQICSLLMQLVLKRFQPGLYLGVLIRITWLTEKYSKWLIHFLKSGL